MSVVLFRCVGTLDGREVAVRHADRARVCHGQVREVQHGQANPLRAEGDLRLLTHPIAPSRARPAPARTSSSAKTFIRPKPSLSAYTLGPWRICTSAALDATVRFDRERIELRGHD